LDVFAAPACHAIEAGSVMMNEDTVALMEAAYRASRCGDNAYRLMAKHERSLATNVPGHYIAGADTARCNADQQVVRARLGLWAVLKADISEIVKTSNLHWHGKTLRSCELACQSDGRG
jgi:hypothetical protein